MFGNAKCDINQLSILSKKTVFSRVKTRVSGSGKPRKVCRFSLRRCRDCRVGIPENPDPGILRPSPQIPALLYTHQLEYAEACGIQKVEGDISSVVYTATLAEVNLP